MYILVHATQKADSVIKRRERVAFELLRPHLLRVQGGFRVERMRQETHYAYPISLNANCDCRGIYPRTWAQPLQDLLVQLATATSQQANGYMAEATQTVPVMVSLLTPNAYTTHASMDNKTTRRNTNGSVILRELEPLFSGLAAMKISL